MVSLIIQGILDSMKYGISWRNEMMFYLHILVVIQDLYQFYVEEMGKVSLQLKL